MRGRFGVSTPVGSRAAALVVALVGVGCRPAADAEPVGSPSGSVAGTEVVASQARATALASGTRGGPSSALIAVVTTQPSEAQPCERVCGSLGECLQGGAAYSPSAAFGLELGCLDSCVNAPDEAPIKNEFLACERHSDCASLEACAERSWDALAGVSVRPAASAVVVAATDSCKSGCRWLYSCMFSNAPPGQGYLDPEMDKQMNTCVAECDTIAPEQVAVMDKLAACLPSHCSPDAMQSCWNDVY